MTRQGSFFCVIPFLVVLLFAGATIGCQGVTKPAGSTSLPAGNPIIIPTPDDVLSSDRILISLEAPVFSPPLGDGRLVFRVADVEDQPIDTATLQIRGDMTHADMMPIEATVAGGENGIYRAPVRWTMAGDWIVTVEATLSDGRQASRSFDLEVGGEEESCIDGQ